MTRRILIGLVLGVASAAPVAAPAGPAERPHVVFIMADDLGWGDVGFHGGSAPTPHLDRLAAASLELRRHYVAPVCSPTRASLLTGRYWSRFGVTNPQNQRALPWDTITLPRALKDAGYETALVGKWHLGSRPEEGPEKFGFDRSYGSLAGGVSPWGHRYKMGPFSQTWHRDGRLIEEQGHVTDLLAQEAVRRIGAAGERPLFLYVPFTAVHLPIKEPKEWLDRVPAGIEGEVARQYAACVMHLDDAVGRIQAALVERAIHRNTLLVFTSDNGGSTAENNDRSYPDDGCPDGRLPGNNRPFRGEKGSLYEGGTRVPTLVSWPGRVSPGKPDTPVQIADWMPTLCAIAGYRPRRDLKWDGTDLSRLLLEGNPPPQRPLYAVAPGRRARTLRLGEWKLIQHTGGREELFHLGRDPTESTNLAEREPGTAAELRAALETAAARDNDALAGP